MIRGVVFDLDHTLFDRYATLRKVLPIMYEKLHNNIAPNLSCEQFVEGVILHERAAIHRGWHFLVGLLIAKGIFLPGMSADAVVDCLFNDCWPVAAIKYTFTEPTLKWLRNNGYKLGIITNGIHKHQLLKIEMLGFGPFFDEIIICGDLEKQKPDTLPFYEMSRRLGIAAQELMYAGDNPVNDVDASRRAGYTPVWIRTTGSWIFENVAHPEYELDSIAAIPDLLKKINKL